MDSIDEHSRILQQNGIAEMLHATQIEVSNVCYLTPPILYSGCRLTMRLIDDDDGCKGEVEMFVLT